MSDPMTPDKTLEELAREYTMITPWEPDEFEVILKVGSQSFKLAHSFPNDEAEWMQKMLAAALANVIKSATAAQQREVEQAMNAFHSAVEERTATAKENDSLREQLRTERERVKELEEALQICWADSHFIQLAWCEEQSPMLAQTIENIRKRSAIWKPLSHSGKEGV